MFSGQDVKSIFRTMVPIAKDLVESYMAKDESTDNLTWLTEQAEKYMPGVPVAEIMDMEQEILGSVDRFSANMNALNKACAEGSTKEEWLRDFLEENAGEQSMQDRGEYLQQVYENLAAGNEAASKLRENPETEIQLSEEMLDEAAPPSGTEWNKYNMQELVDGISDEAIRAGMQGMTAPADAEALEGIRGMAGAIPPELANGSLTDNLDRGVKLAATAALTFLSRTRKIPILSKLFPISSLATLACWGIEGAKCIGKCAAGQMTTTQAVEHMKRASVVAAADFITSGLAPKLFCAIPVVGVPLSYAVPFLLPELANEEVQQKLYEGMTKISELAQATAQNISEKAKVVIGIKNKVVAVAGTEA